MRVRHRHRFESLARFEDGRASHRHRLSRCLSRPDGVGDLLRRRGGIAAALIDVCGGCGGRALRPRHRAPARSRPRRFRRVRAPAVGPAPGRRSRVPSSPRRPRLARAEPLQPESRLGQRAGTHARAVDAQQAVLRPGVARLPFRVVHLQRYFPAALPPPDFVHERTVCDAMEVERREGPSSSPSPAMAMTFTSAHWTRSSA